MNSQNSLNKPKKVVLQIVAHGVADKKGRRSTNGPEIRALRGLDYHDKSLFKFIVCYSSKGNLWEEFTKHKEIELIDFSVESKYQFSAIQKMSKIIRTKKVDLIHTQGPGSVDFFASCASSLTKTPLIITRPVMIEDWIRPNLKKKIYALFDKFTLNHASLVVAVSKAGVKYLTENSRLPKQKVSLIYNGVDVNLFTPSKKATDDNDTLCIGTCAQLAPHKGWPDFLRVIYLCKKKFPKLKCIIVGDGPLRKEVLNKANSMGIFDAIDLVGFQKNVTLYLRKMDIFLMTSWSEGLPVATIEAMAAGLPVVATSVGGVSELVIHGETGYLGPPNNPEVIADFVSLLLENKELREKLGKSGRERVEKNFVIQKMVSEYEKIYINCLK